MGISGAVRPRGELDRPACSPGGHRRLPATGPAASLPGGAGHGRYLARARGFGLPRCSIRGPLPPPSIVSSKSSPTKVISCSPEPAAPLPKRPTCSKTPGHGPTCTQAPSPMTRAHARRPDLPPSFGICWHSTTMTGKPSSAGAATRERPIVFGTVGLVGQTGTVLDGGAGDDTLSGGAGSDDLIGGAGVDRLRGGGNDTFLFQPATGSKASTRNQILDFGWAGSRGDDVIGVSALDANASRTGNPTVQFSGQPRAPAIYGSKTASPARTAS